MSLSKALYPPLSTGSTQEERKSSLTWLKMVDWDVEGYLHLFACESIEGSVETARLQCLARAYAARILR